MLSSTRHVHYIVVSPSAAMPSDISRENLEATTRSDPHPSHIHKDLSEMEGISSRGSDYIYSVIIQSPLTKKMHSRYSFGCPIVQESFRLHGRTSFSRLSWLSLEDAFNNARPEGRLRGSLLLSMLGAGLLRQCSVQSTPIFISFLWCVWCTLINKRPAVR